MKKVIIFLVIFLKSEHSFGADFYKSIPVILKHEGLYSNNKNDRGGSTKYGISVRYLEELYKKNPKLMGSFDLNKDGIINDYDIYHMNQQEAIEIYKSHWWDFYGYGNISNQKLATKIFDISINVGHVRAHFLLKKALKKNILLKDIELDGILDSDTIKKINIVCYFSCKNVLYNFQEEAIVFYKGLAEKNESYRVFLNGWIKRVKDLDY